MKTIIDMAREAGGLGFVHDAGDAPSKWQFTPKELEAFAALVRAEAQAEEREACAKVCESYLSESPHSWGGTTMAAAIRARGNT